MKRIAIPVLAALLASCTTKAPSSYSNLDKVPSIFPDYTDITIPANIAPMNFSIDEQADEYITVFSTSSASTTVKGRKVRIPESKWRKLTAGSRITVQVYGRNGKQWNAYTPFSMSVSDDIDPYISYRIIPISVESYEKLSIRQRNITNFREKVIFANTMVQNNEQGTCINCHHYKNWETDNMLFHVRHFKGGTVFILDGELHKINTKTDSTISAGSYPSWHPTHDFVAFASDKVHQSIHALSHDKLEVMDDNSDIILFDIRNNTVSPIENETDQFECFPDWSSDGKSLFYVSSTYQMPEGVSRRDAVFLDRFKFHYNLYSKPFDPETRTWGTSRLLYDAVAADSSITWPKASPDGRWLLCCISTHGMFPLDQIQSDFILFDLKDNSYRYVDELNSPFAESFHCWSSNGKWFMFSTRREDAVHTRLYFSHIDENGHFSKPFALPQRDPEFNREFLNAFNIGEFMKEPVHITPRRLASFISSTDATPSKYESKKEK